MSELPISQLSAPVHVRYSVSRAVESRPENVKFAVRRLNVAGGISWIGRHLGEA